MTGTTITASPGGRTTQTDSTGAFKIALTPGTYTLSVSSKGMTRCTDRTVSVQAHRYTYVTISCDTGIR